MVLALVAAPFAVQAETINIYAWQNYSWEALDVNGRSFDRISGNAANIGFNANVDTGLNDIHVTFQCESWALHNHWAGQGGWCTRNSKIGLSHPQAGEIMFATWLLPYNEAVAQWIDPFYDAGGDSHTSIMGSVGASTIYHSPGDWKPRDNQDRPADYAIGLDTGFNRRQQEIIQYFSPNWNGLKFRFAWTAGYEDESVYDGEDGFKTNELDPVIRSSSLTYEDGPLWLATTWQAHEDWTASRQGIQGTMKSSDSESFRVAARYIFDMGGGASFQIGAMYEDLEYEFDGTVDAITAMNSFYFLGFGETGNFDATKVRTEKTNAFVEATLTPAERGELGLEREQGAADDAEIGGLVATATVIEGINNKKLADRTVGEKSQVNTYNKLVTAAKRSATAGSDVKIERDAWIISGKIKFGGPLDFRFSYLDAGDLEVSCRACSGDWNATAADAWNLGLFYTMPSGTELRLTYSEVDNDKNGTYAQGVSGTGYGTPGNEVEMFAVGIVHWFD